MHSVRVIPKKLLRLVKKGFWLHIFQIAMKDTQKIVTYLRIYASQGQTCRGTPSVFSLFPKFPCPIACRWPWTYPLAGQSAASEDRYAVTAATVFALLPGRAVPNFPNCRNLPREPVCSPIDTSVSLVIVRALSFYFHDYFFFVPLCHSLAPSSLHHWGGLLLLSMRFAMSSGIQSFHSLWTRKTLS